MEPLSTQERKQLYIRIGIRLLLTALLITALALLGPPLLKLFGPFILAFIVALIINPIVRAINKKLGTSRRIVTLIIIVVLTVSITGLFSAIIYRVAREIVDLASNWQTVWAGIESGLSLIVEQIQGISSILPEEAEQILVSLGESILGWVESALSVISETVLTYAPRFATSVANTVVSLVVFIMASYFITADYPRLKFILTDKLGSLNKSLSVIKQAASGAIGGYLKAQLILSTGVGAIVYVVLLLMGQSYALIIAICTAVIDFVPFFGSGIVLVPWAIFAFISGNRVTCLILLALAFVLFLARKFAEPKIVGGQTGISPLLSLVSMFVGMRLGGVVGMIAGPIICMMFLSVYRTGIFDGFISDLKCMYRDLSDLLSRKV